MFPLTSISLNEGNSGGYVPVKSVDIFARTTVAFDIQMDVSSHTVNAKDYTLEQRNVWATGREDPELWNRSFLEHDTRVAVEDGIIVGFGDMDRTGYLDRLYVHAEYQGRGIGTALCDQLEQAVQGKLTTITTHASITARPFFERRGYCVERCQQVERQGIVVMNYVMKNDRKQ